MARYVRRSIAVDTDIGGLQSFPLLTGRWKLLLLCGNMEMTKRPAAVHLFIVKERKGVGLRQITILFLDLCMILVGLLGFTGIL